MPHSRTDPAPAAATPPAPSKPPEPTEWPYPRLLPWVLLVGGLVGALAAFVLAVEKFTLLTDPGYVPSCSLNPILSCGSIMKTPQAEAFGFPNPLLGVAAFPVVAAVGAMMLSGLRPPRWMWWSLQAGSVAGVVFVHWLIVQSLYRIGALCPYCMVVWVVTIAICWYVTTATLAAGLAGRRAAAAGRVLVAHHGIAVTLWLLVIATLILVEFFDYWAATSPVGLP